MSEEEKRIRWPNGVSVSTPALRVIPGVGRTYYSNPGSPTAPQVTWTLRRGLGGGGFHAVYLRDGMTSQDTLGMGATASAGLGVNATMNARRPDPRRPWNMQVSSIEGGLGLPGFGTTITLTPQQIADILSRPGPNNRAEFVRDSAAAAGVPSRKNAFEYGFPDSNPARPSVPGTDPADGFDNSSSPVLLYLERYRRSAASNVQRAGSSVGQPDPVENYDTPSERLGHVPGGPSSQRIAPSPEDHSWAPTPDDLSKAASYESVPDATDMSTPYLSTHVVDASGTERLVSLIPIASRSDVSNQAQKQPGQLTGIVTGQPPYPLPSSVFGEPDKSGSSGNDIEDMFARWIKSYGR